MKTAIIVAGATRFSEISFSSWSFPIDADYFLFTWDLTQHTYSEELFSAEEEISFLRSTTRFKEIYVHNYIDFLKEYNGHHSSRILFLYRDAFNKLKNLDYERIILLRPDLFLVNNNAIEDDFNLSGNVALILGMHEPDHWIKIEERYIEDQLFCMDWVLFEKLAGLLELSLALRRSNIGVHRILFEFFNRNNIVLRPLTSYRSVIIRKSAADAIKGGRTPDYNFLLDEFMKLYIENKTAIKFHRKLHLSKLY